MGLSFPHRGDGPLAITGIGGTPFADVDCCQAERSTTMRKIIGLALALSFAAAAVAADRAEMANDNWPSWRGPTANGVAPAGANPPIRWDAATNIKWQTELPGLGRATPVVWVDQVFVVTAGKTERETQPKQRA